MYVVPDCVIVGAGEREGKPLGDFVHEGAPERHCCCVRRLAGAVFDAVAGAAMVLLCKSHRMSLVAISHIDTTGI